MAADRNLPGFEPPHPGDYLREDILPALDMTITQLAEHLGVSRASLSELVNANRSVSLEMAQRLGQAFRNGTRFWMALQMQRDIWLAEQNSRVSVKPIVRKSSRAA
ncbi:MAG: HigA family addiction module antitoxin [Hyphomicrobiaceae bacterium]|nr:HigA family addiction module antitoxin [Hyphomicrobiaceae bacterium]